MRRQRLFTDEEAEALTNLVEQYYGGGRINFKALMVRFRELYPHHAVERTQLQNYIKNQRKMRGIAKKRREMEERSDGEKGKKAARSSVKPEQWNDAQGNELRNPSCELFPSDGNCDSIMQYDDMMGDLPCTDPMTDREDSQNSGEVCHPPTVSSYQELHMSSSSLVVFDPTRSVAAPSKADEDATKRQIMTLEQELQKAKQASDYWVKMYARQNEELKAVKEEKETLARSLLAAQKTSREVQELEKTKAAVAKMQQELATKEKRHRDELHLIRRHWKEAWLVCERSLASVFLPKTSA